MAALRPPASAPVTREMGGIIATLHGLALPVDRVSPWHAFRLTPVTRPELAATAHLPTLAVLERLLDVVR